MRPKPELPVKEEFHTYYIKKKLSDTMAGFAYTIGCSLVHLSLLVALSVVKWPDVEKAKQYDTLIVETAISHIPNLIAISQINILQDSCTR